MQNRHDFSAIFAYVAFGLDSVHVLGKQCRHSLQMFGKAVTEVLQLLTGFGGRGLRRADVALSDRSTLQRGFRKLDGVRGTLEDWGAARRPDCTFCRSTLAAGVVGWAPAA